MSSGEVGLPAMKWSELVLCEADECNKASVVTDSLMAYAALME